MRVLTLFALACCSGLLHGQGVVQPFPGTVPSMPSKVDDNGETLEQRVMRLRHELAEAEHALAAQRMQQGNTEASTPVEEEAPESIASAIPTGALVVVSGSQSSGSGFIAELKGRSFLVTNIHVLGAARGAIFETIEGERIDIGSVAFLSQTRDIAIIPIEWEGPRFEVSHSLGYDEVAVGQDIVVMGNSDGASVATELKGEIRGLGPETIEVSAKFVPGNSGSPIIHQQLGTVVGIASYLRDFSEKTKWTEDSELADIRRFGYRLDGEIQWQRIELNELYYQAEAYHRFEDRTKAMWEIGYRLEYESKLVTGYRDHESLGYLYDDINSDFNWGRGTASSRNIQILQRFVRRMQIELTNDMTDTEEILSVNFYRDMFDELKPMRQRIGRNFTHFEEARL